jgi:hypothetical protein
MVSSENFVFTFVFNINDFRADFSPPIKLNAPSKIALISLDGYNVFPNINDSNNVFRYSKTVKENKEWFEIKVPEGIYDKESITEYIEENINISKTRNYVEFDYNENTMKFSLKISKGITVDFSHASSLNKIFGFNKVELNEGSHKSDNIVDLDPVKHIYVECDIVDNYKNYINGKRSKCLYNFTIDNEINEKFHKEPYNPIYVPVIYNEFRDMYIKIKDSHGNVLDLKDSEIVMKLHLTTV